jgi:hypothetical protein
MAWPACFDKLGTGGWDGVAFVPSLWQDRSLRPNHPTVTNRRL